MWFFFLGMPSLQKCHLGLTGLSRVLVAVLRAPLLFSLSSVRKILSTGWSYNLQVSKLQWHSFCPFSRGEQFALLVKNPNCLMFSSFWPTNSLQCIEREREREKKLSLINCTLIPPCQTRWPNNPSVHHPWMKP
jgi:hypothetical protein